MSLLHVSKDLSQLSAEAYRFDFDRALVTATVGVGAMLYISAKLTAVMLFIVPPISVAAVYYGRYLKTLSRKTQKAVGEMIAVSEERLGAIRCVPQDAIRTSNS